MDLASLTNLGTLIGLLFTAAASSWASGYTAAK